MLHIRNMKPRQKRIWVFSSTYYAYQIFYGVKSFNFTVKLEIFNKVCTPYIIIT